MTAVGVAVSLSAALLVSALAGPATLRHASPALMRRPRVAIALISAGVAAWLGALAALGPLLAWIVSGPALLPARAGEVCQRCLAAANPFPDDPIATAVPALLLVGLPALALIGHLAVVAARLTRHHRGALAAARVLHAHSTARTLHGHRVRIIVDAVPFALALPARRGGIVVSSGALDRLAADELAAVLAHESAHVRQHHHLIATLLTALTHGLRWVPALGSGVDALGHYLEIAADDSARRRVGRNALARALLTLGQVGSHDRDRAVWARFALHAHGPNRVHHLVGAGEAGAGAGRGALVASVGALAALTSLAAVVHIPYALAALGGCAPLA